MNTSGSHVAVVGGGFAGLAAAVRLARAGARVTLLERRPFLGGRAYSFADPVTGDVVDNGPHALMGAYTEALDFLREIGAAGKVRMQRRLRVTLAEPQLGMGAVAAPPVPGPVQGAAALLRYRLLSPADRVRLLAGAVRLAARGDGWRGATVAEALARLGQSAEARARFWHPLAIAALNEVPEAAAAAPFAAVVRRSSREHAPPASFFPPPRFPTSTRPTPAARSRRRAARCSPVRPWPRSRSMAIASARPCCATAGTFPPTPSCSPCRAGHSFASSRPHSRRCRRFARSTRSGAHRS